MLPVSVCKSGFDQLSFPRALKKTTGLGRYLQPL